MVVWPDISSPAQSLASVINVPSNSCLPRLAFCSFCLGSFGDSSGSLRQQMNAKARHRRTISSPAKNVKMLDNRKHHHFRSIRHSSIGASVVINPSSQPDIPYQIVAGIFYYFMSSTFINHWTSLSATMLATCHFWIFCDHRPHVCYLQHRLRNMFLNYFNNAFFTTMTATTTTITLRDKEILALLSTLCI